MPYPEEFHELAKAVNNWGRWGDDDEIGTLNFLTPDAVRHAASLVRTGRRFSLAMQLSMSGPQTGAIPGRVNPVRTMLAINRPVVAGDPAELCMNDDAVFMALQGATHWDALSHVSYDGRLYNGYGAAAIDADGAARCGIDKVTSLVGRGVLLDVAAAAGVDQLPESQPIGPAELDAAVKHGNLTIRSGDIVLVRTGHMAKFHAGGAGAYGQLPAGLSVYSPAWFHRHEVAAVATDQMTFELVWPEIEDAWLPVHALHLVEMGLTQGQNWDLEALAADCASDGIYEFFLSASPEPFVGGVGSPVNPVAIK